MKILFVVKTYHDADEYIINNKNLLQGKNYHEIINFICSFFSNWVSEFYLFLHKENKINTEIIFPSLNHSLDEILGNGNKKNYEEYFNHLIYNYNPDVVIFGGEYDEIKIKCFA